MAKEIKKNKPGQGAKPDPELKKLLPKIKQLYKTKSFTEVAEELKISTHTVRNAVVKHKFKKSSWHWDKPWEDLVLKLWPNHSPVEISEQLKAKFGIDKSKWSVINKYRERAGLR